MNRDDFFWESILHNDARGLFIGTDEVKKVVTSLRLKKKTGSR